MRLARTLLAASAAIAFTAAAAAQNSPATSTTAPTQTKPDEPTTAPPPDAGKSATAPGQTETTPGQSQTTPGEASQINPATTGVTPSGQTTGQAQTHTEKVTSSDLKKGLSVYDQNGGLVGKIESVSSKGALVSTGKAKVMVPVGSFAKTEKGLAIGMTKAQVEAAVKKSSPKPK